MNVFASLQMTSGVKHFIIESEILEKPFEFKCARCVNPFL